MSAQEECLRRYEEPPPVWWLPLYEKLLRVGVLQGNDSLCPFELTIGFPVEYR